MTDREEGLAALRSQIGGIDPVLDAADGYVAAIKETQKTVRQQGQVMSATLANNHTLYHTNKKLVLESRAQRGRIQELEKEITNLRTQIIELQDTLSEGGGDRYKTLYTKAIRTLNAYQYDLLDNDQLKQRLDEMKAQAAEIEALPERATPEYIAQNEYADPYHPQAQAEAAFAREAARQKPY